MLTLLSRPIFCLSTRYFAFIVCRRKGSSSSSSHYAVLGVSNDATKAEIKSAFVALCKKYHPDKNFSVDAKLSSEKFSRINEAYSILIDPVKRSLHDRELYSEYLQSPYHPRQGGKGDGNIDFYRYNPRNNAYTYARAYNYSFKEADWNDLRPSNSDFRRKNFRFLGWLVVFMMFSSFIFSLRIWYTHKIYDEQSTARSRKYKAIYDDIIEQRKFTTLEEKMEKLRSDMELDCEDKKK